jgi:hypothetical protein
MLEAPLHIPHCAAGSTLVAHSLVKPGHTRLKAAVGNQNVARTARHAIASGLIQEFRSHVPCPSHRFDPLPGTFRCRFQHCVGHVVRREGVAK